MKLRFRHMIAEFKAFAFKGNMIDLAVAVVIGGAFAGVISSLVKDIIMPSISYVTTAAADAGHVMKNAAEKAGAIVGVATKPTTASSTTQASSQPTPPPEPPVAVAPPPAPAPAEPKAVDIDWKIGRIQIGRFVGELINFVLIAFSVFLLVVKLLGSVMKRVGGTPKPNEVTTKECPRCLSLIPVKATRCPQCTSELPEVVNPPLAT